MAQLLERGEVLAHPWVNGELALATLRNRTEILNLLDHLPQAVLASDIEVRQLVEAEQLFGQGIGFIDAHLLASTLLTQNSTTLWTRDKRLDRTAQRLGLA